MFHGVLIIWMFTVCIRCNVPEVKSQSKDVLLARAYVHDYQINEKTYLGSIRFPKMEDGRARGNNGLVWC